MIHWLLIFNEQWPFYPRGIHFYYCLIKKRWFQSLHYENKIIMKKCRFLALSILMRLKNVRMAQFLYTYINNHNRSITWLPPFLSHSLLHASLPVVCSPCPLISSFHPASLPPCLSPSLSSLPPSINTWTGWRTGTRLVYQCYPPLPPLLLLLQLLLLFLQLLFLLLLPLLLLLLLLLPLLLLLFPK